MSEVNKARYWWAVLYPENMLPFWEEKLPDLVQVPFAFCVHILDKDSKSDHRKDHIHLILVFPNTTTYKHAFNIFDKLSLENKHCLNKIEACSNIRYCYNYLIHDTDSCRKNNKYFYSDDNRITGNLFDIGSYEQLSTEEKKQMKIDLSNFILDNCIDNYALFVREVNKSFSSDHLEIVYSYSGHFERLCKGNYLLNVCYKNKSI